MTTPRRPPHLHLAAAAAILALGALVACGGSGGGSPTAASLTVGDIEFQSLALINDSRAGEGLAALGGDPAAAAVARAHSEAMRDGGFFGHSDPATGHGLRQRLRAGGVSFSAAAENLVQVRHGGNPAGVAHAELMASSTHRENILDARFELAGIGVARSGDSYWLTQIFIRP